MNLEKKIIEFRKKMNLTQEQLANKLDVTRQTISNWESGITSPDINQALSLAKIFGVAITDLLDEELEIKCRTSNSILNKLVGKTCFLDIQEDDYRIDYDTPCIILDVNDNFLKFQFTSGKKTITKLIDKDLVDSFRIIEKKVNK